MRNEVTTSQLAHNYRMASLEALEHANNHNGFDGLENYYDEAAQMLHQAHTKITLESCADDSNSKEPSQCWAVSKSFSAM